MSNYAIGSVNGHYQQLLQLLETIQFTPEQDVLWFTGNLINGGLMAWQCCGLLKI